MCVYVYVYVYVCMCNMRKWFAGVVISGLSGTVDNVAQINCLEGRPCTDVTLDQVTLDTCNPSCKLWDCNPNPDSPDPDSILTLILTLTLI